MNTPLSIIQYTLALNSNYAFILNKIHYFNGENTPISTNINHLI